MYDDVIITFPAVKLYSNHLTINGIMIKLNLPVNYLLLTVNEVEHRD